MFKFLKGMMTGILVGACAGLMVSPRTKRHIKRSEPCRMIKRLCRSVENAANTLPLPRI